MNDLISLLDALERRGEFFLAKKIPSHWHAANKLVEEKIIYITKDDKEFTWYGLKK